MFHLQTIEMKFDINCKLICKSDGMWSSFCYSSEAIELKKLCRQHNCNITLFATVIYRAYTKEWCGIKSEYTIETAPFFCVCPVYIQMQLHVP
jgi:hypothetical protein